MGENMNYPDNPVDFVKAYCFDDGQGLEVISVFRVGQLIEHYMSDLTPQQIKDMQFCLREKSRECAELRRELQVLKKRDTAKTPVEFDEHWYKCPRCGKYSGGLKGNFCHMCGQRLKWED